MQALILAGGLGTRLRPLTETYQKCMIEVAGRPFLTHLISRLKAFGIDDFVIAAGYKSKQIEKHFGDGSNWGCQINYSIEKSLKGTGGALDEARKYLRDDFMVLNGDNLLDINYTKMIELFNNNKEWIGVMAVFLRGLGKIKALGKFRPNVLWEPLSATISQYDYDNSEEKNGLDAGVKIFRSEIFSLLPKKDNFSLEKEVLPGLAKCGRIGAFPALRAPLDIGEPDHLWEARKILTAASYREVFKNETSKQQ